VSHQSDGNDTGQQWFDKLTMTCTATFPIAWSADTTSGIASLEFVRRRLNLKAIC